MGFDVLGHLLEEGRGGTAAAGTRRDLWRKAPEAERLEHLLRHLHFLGPVAAGPRREGDADRVAAPLVEAQRQTRRAGDAALRVHSARGEPQVLRILGAAR